MINSSHRKYLLKLSNIAPSASVTESDPSVSTPGIDQTCQYTERWEI
jgi:hypothetical protein